MSTATTVEGLKRALGDAQVVTDPARLGERRHDYWMISHLRDRRGTPAPAPACVVRPRSAADVQAAIRFAAEHGVPVIPFGLGSGVVGGVIARPDAIVIDLSGMNRVRAIDPVNLLASFDAGKNGAEAEAAVAEQGLTIGHWPQSVAVSSVGGWVATRASGQFSTANGNIEDIVHSIEAVLPNGDLVVLGKGPARVGGPRPAAPDAGLGGDAGRDHRRHLLAAAGAGGAGALGLRDGDHAGRVRPAARDRPARLAPAGDAAIRRAREPPAGRAAQPLRASYGARGAGGAGRGGDHGDRRAGGRDGRRAGAGRRRRALARAPQQRAALGLDPGAEHGRRHGRGVGRLGRDRQGLRRRCGQPERDPWLPRRLGAQLPRLSQRPQSLLHLRRPAAGPGRHGERLLRGLEADHGRRPIGTAAACRTITASAGCAATTSPASWGPRAWRCSRP